MLWSKQYYHYSSTTGSGATASVRRRRPSARKRGRNHEWPHLATADVLSMPDKWEYPWFAAWDMAFHCVAFALIDPDFAKQQLILLTREWYMHPNGQMPAYEWAFGDVNPPVHAWAAIRVCQIEQKMTGRMDRLFLERIFQKLLINFTWWVNRKDAGGNNLFEGGFLGLDNIGAFDRSVEPARWRAARAGRRHELDGDVLPEHARHRARTGEGGPGLRGRRDQVLRALRLHRRSDQPRRRQAPTGCGTRRHGYYFDVLQAARRSLLRA